jgi:pyruvate/2-oxoglutarate dehydrogenase complex dihydrolipoamide acyltransferase (E2) component
MRTSVSALVVLFCVLTLVPRTAAQSTHAAPTSAIDAALQQHVSSTDADRALVLRVLETPAVQELAAELGVDLRSARSAIATLEGEPLVRLAAQAEQVDRALAGGQGSVTISYTLIIIGLLLLILLVLIL